MYFQFGFLHPGRPGVYLPPSRSGPSEARVLSSETARGVHGKGDCAGKVLPYLLRLWHVGRLLPAW